MARPQIRFSLGVKIHMSKKLFLAAASVAAMTFAGAASAGTISGSVASQPFSPVVGSTPAVAYTVASETKIAAATPLATVAGGFVATNALTNPIKVIAGTTQNYVVKFDISGGTIPTAAAVDLVAINSAGVITSGVTFAAATRTATSVTYIATVTAPGGAGGSDIDVTGFRLSTQVSVASNASPVAVSGSVDLLAGGSQFNVDTAGATTAIDFKPLLKSLTVDAKTATAELPNFKEFKSGAGAGSAVLSNSDLTAQLATNISALNGGTYYSDLQATAATAATVLTGATVTVVGPQNLSANLAPALSSGGTVAYVDGAAVFTLNATQAQAFVANSSFTLTEAATEANRVAMAAGGYTITFAPTVAAAFNAPTASSAAAGTISLDGVNFVAPWVSGTGAATSVIRISNSSDTPSGPVTVRLKNAVKVVSGVSTPVTSDVVYAAGTVPAGGDLQINSNALVGAFGDFTRGDFQVTIQSSAAPLTAKLRNTRDGQTFEQSLGTGL